MKKIVFLIPLFLLASIYAYSDNSVDESSLFSEGSYINTNNLIDNTILSNIETSSISISGIFQTTANYGMSRKWLEGSTNTDLNSMSESMQGNILMDVRLTKGFKAFLNVEGSYIPQGVLTPHNYTIGPNNLGLSSITLSETNNTQISIIEFFADINIMQMIYFRVGKQVLQWGRCYLWNPSDLINVEKKDFLNLAAFREGAYGLKLQIPYGTAMNIYGFANVSGTSKIENMALAGKLELLINPVEFSISAWAKKDYHPIFAMDFYTSFLGINVYGEASFADYDMKPKVLSNAISFDGFDTTTNIAAYNITNQLVSKVALGFSKTFDVFDLKSWLSVTGEFFYNSTGYTNNIFTDETFRTKGLNYYDANNHAAYYAALFTTINKVFISDITYAFNMIWNLNDKSLILMSYLSYRPVYNFTISWNLDIFQGNEYAEYTYSGRSITTGILASMRF